MRDRSGTRSREGFALGLVVMMLFAIAVAGASGYLVVNSEFALAVNSREGGEALTVARAGLQRFVGESIGVVGDSVSYAISGGTVTVTTRKLAEQDSVTHLYYIRSEGRVVDARRPGAPATRVVAAYAWHHTRPLAHHGAVMITATTIAVDNLGVADGTDYNSAVDCAGGGTAGIAGAIATTAVTEGATGIVAGSPDSALWAGGYSEMYDSVGLRWDVLQNAAFPFEFDGSPPSFASLPADSFPLVRYQGNLAPGSSWVRGPIPRASPGGPSGVPTPGTLASSATPTGARR